MKKSSLFFHLNQQKMQELEIPRDRTAHWLFASKMGRFTNRIISLPQFSQWIALYAKSSFSRTKISSFRREFQINDTDFVDSNYKTLNEYFIRSFKPGARVFASASDEFASPAEGYAIAATSEFLPVKGITANASALLSRQPQFLISCSCSIRLTPKEYHRFHFPMDGEIVDQYEVDGKLYSINPTTLAYEPNLFIRNKRLVLHLKFKSGNQCYLILIGATYIGSVISHKKKGDRFRKGDEAGFFEFGGSTAVILFDKNFSLNEQVLAHSSQSIESFIELGTALAISTE